MANGRGTAAIKAVSIVVGVVLFVVFATWTLALMFTINSDLRDVQSSQNDLENAWATFLSRNADNINNGNNGNNNNDNDATSTAIINVYNTQLFNSYASIESGPVVDGLLKSAVDNGRPCILPVRDAPVALPLLNDLNSTLVQVVRAWEDVLVDLGVHGTALAVMYEGEVILERHYGTIKIGGDPVTENTIFCIGGVTRLLTSLLAFSLRDSDKWSLDDALVKHLPEFDIINPYNQANITIRQILGDISGLPRNAPPGCGSEGCDLTTAEVLQSIVDTEMSLINPPYVLPSRSDLGYSLAGRAVETISGISSYEQALQDYITDPFGMSDTTFTVDAGDNARLATGYEGDEEVTHVDLGWLRPWGGAFSTLADMKKLLTKLSAIDEPGSDDNLSAQTIRELLSPLFMGFDGKTGQGTPFQMIYLKDRMARSLGGAISGFGTHVLLVPAVRLSIVAMSNTDVDMSRFTVPAATLLIPPITQQLSIPKPLNPPTNPSEFIGLFQGQNPLGQPGDLIITAEENGHLRAQDTRFTGKVYYDLTYKGAETAGQHFVVLWKGDPLFLTCQRVFNTAVNGASMYFSEYRNGRYDKVVFQQDEYRLVQN